MPSRLGEIPERRAPGEPLGVSFDTAASGAIRFTVKAGQRTVASGVLAAPSPAALA